VKDFGISLQEIGESSYDPVYYYAPWFMENNKVTLLTGAPGSGKSFVLGTLALCMAGGLPFLGQPFTYHRPLRVAYLDLEMMPELAMYYFRLMMGGLEIEPTDSIEDRLAVWCDGTSGYPPGLHLGQSIRGDDENWGSHLGSILSLTRPDVAIIEPLVNLCGPMVNDYDNRMVNSVLRRLKSYPDVRWIVGHHEGKYNVTSGGEKKSAQQRIRGGTGIAAAVDRHMTLSVGRDSSRTIEFGKARGQFGLPKSFSFRAEVNIAAGKARLERCNGS